MQAAGVSWLGMCQSPRLQLLKLSQLSTVNTVKTFLSLTDCSLLGSGSGGSLRHLGCEGLVGYCSATCAFSCWEPSV